MDVVKPGCVVVDVDRRRYRMDGRRKAGMCGSAECVVVVASSIGGDTDGVVT